MVGLACHEYDPHEDAASHRSAGRQRRPDVESRGKEHRHDVGTEYCANELSGDE